MNSDDIDLDAGVAEEYPDDCARGLRKYLFVMAVIVVGTLSGTFWYQAMTPDGHSAGAPMGSFAMEAPFAGGRSAAPLMANGFGGAPQPTAVLAAVPTSYPDFAAVVAGLQGTVVSVGRSRVEGRFGVNRGGLTAAEPGPPGAAGGAPAGEGGPAGGALQFAVPAAGAVLESVGTGFIVRNDGYILTNYHVVRGNDSMVVTVFDAGGGQRYPATIVKLDASVDLALLKIEPRTALAAVALGDSDQTNVADEVIAIGSPFGLDLTVSRGIISAKRKSLVIEGTVHRDLLQTDAAINQGNSGGPLVDRAGEVIGINTAIYTPTGAFAGVGFAVPSNQAKLFLADELALQAGQPMAGGGGLWGMTVAVPPGGAAMAGPPIVIGAAAPHRDGREAMDCGICHQMLPRAGQAPRPAATVARGLTAAAPGGAMMAGPPITIGAPAPHRDGREAMDCGICHQMLPRTGQAPRPAATMARGVTAAVPGMAPPPIVAGTPPPHRDGRETMDCAMCHKFIPAGGAATAAPVAQTGAGGGLQFARPPATFALNVAAAVPGGAPPGGILILGASTLPVTAALAAQTGQTEGKGVFVAQVVPGSPAAVAGLEAGMVIEKVDGRRLRAPRDLVSVIEAAKPGDRLRLAVTGDKGRRELQLIVSVLPVAAPGATGAAGGVAPKVPTEFNWRGMEIETFASVGTPGNGGGAQLKGAVIAEVVPGSPAQRAGLQANDIIVEVAGQSAATAALLNHAVQAVTGKREIMMRMARSNREFFVVLP